MARPPSILRLAEIMALATRCESHVAYRRLADNLDMTKMLMQFEERTLGLSARRTGLSDLPLQTWLFEARKFQGEEDARVADERRREWQRVHVVRDRVEKEAEHLAALRRPRVPGSKVCINCGTFVLSGDLCGCTNTENVGRPG